MEAQFCAADRMPAGRHDRVPFCARCGMVRLLRACRYAKCDAAHGPKRVSPARLVPLRQPSCAPQSRRSRRRYGFRLRRQFRACALHRLVWELCDDVVHCVQRAPPLIVHMHDVPGSVVGVRVLEYAVAGLREVVAAPIEFQIGLFRPSISAWDPADGQQGDAPGFPAQSLPII